MLEAADPGFPEYYDFGKDEENLISYAQLVLGKEQFELIKSFFGDIRENTARYKVFIARKSLNLMYLFNLTFFQGKDENDSFIKSLYSDIGLIANIPEIVGYYVEYGAFPKALIIDDILIHGRAINALIDKYKLSIFECLEKQGHNIDRYAVERDILNSLSIRVMVINDKPLLIRSQYYPLLKDSIKEGNVWPQKKWLELSSNISLLISEGFFPNTSYVLSMFENTLDGIHKDYENAAMRAGFTKSAWGKRYQRDVWVKPLENKNGDIMAFYTIRITQNAINGRYSILPFVIMSDFTYKSEGRGTKFEQLFDKYKEEYLNIRGISRVRAEAIYLILSYNILLLLQSTFDKEELERLYQMKADTDTDIKKINLSFKNEKNSNEPTLPQKLIDCTEPILSWEQMDSLILRSTENSAPLFRYFQGSGNAGKYKTEMKWQLAQEGEEIERIAFLEYSGRKPNLSYAKKYHLNLIFEKMRENCNLEPPKDPEGIAEVIGSFLRYMDTGVVALYAEASVDGNLNETFHCSYRAGEQSRFIRPKQYSKHLSVLSAMERDCGRNYLEMKRRIIKLYGDDPELVKGLLELIVVLYNSGQLISDWNISLLAWAEKNESDNRESALFYEMVRQTDQRVELLKRYRQVYSN